MWEGLLLYLNPLTGIGFYMIWDLRVLNLTPPKQQRAPNTLLADIGLYIMWEGLLLHLNPLAGVGFHLLWEGLVLHLNTICKMC